MTAWALSTAVIRQLSRCRSTSLPEPTPEQFRELVGRVLTEVFDELAPMHEKYGAFDHRLLPAWISTFPEVHAIKSIGALYQAAFNTGTLAPETKHLAAYVLARGTNHPVMAEDERRIARLVSEDADQLERKLTEADTYAAGASQRSPASRLRRW